MWQFETGWKAEPTDFVDWELAKKKTEKSEQMWTF